MTPSRHIGRLLEIMAALRTPHTACPWDLAQDFSSIAPYYMLEEAYEVADAIAHGNLPGLKEELGGFCCKSYFMPASPKNRVDSTSATSCKRSPRNSFGATRMSSRTKI